MSLSSYLMRSAARTSFSSAMMARLASHVNTIAAAGIMAAAEGVNAVPSGLNTNAKRTQIMYHIN